MSYLDKLLAGRPVTWKPLGEVFEMRNGYTPSKSNPTYWEGGTIPWFRMEDLRTSGRRLGDSIQHITPEAVKGKGLFKAGSILMATTATIGEHALLIADSLANQQFTNFKIRESLQSAITPMFAYYYFFRICEWCKRNVFESSFPSVDMKGLKKVKFPIPPRDVQEEIVRVLDRFTELETELEAELEARQKQYAYYRDLLLTFPDDAVTYLPLGEVCETVTDFTAAGSFASNANNVKYLKAPDYALMVRTTDLKQSFSNSESFVFVDEHAFSYLWRVNLDTESIILPNVGNCGEVYFTIPKDLPHTHCVLGPNALLLRSRNAMNKYLYYWFQSLDFQRRLLKITSKTGQSKFNKTNLKKIPIPIPSLEEQERIVGILDRFETLAHSITEGLPRELELRREQYSYYRDLLLDFPHQD